MSRSPTAEAAPGSWPPTASRRDVGTTTADSNGGAHNATLSGATWTTQGKFGKALSFNGSNNFVSAPDSGALDLTTEMTLEAWVRPTSLGSWGTVVFKEQPGNYAYALYSNTGTNRPSGNAIVGAFDADTRGTAQLPLNTWSHLAVTYDGNMLILYVDGVQVVTAARPRVDRHVDRAAEDRRERDLG